MDYNEEDEIDTGKLGKRNLHFPRNVYAISDPHAEFEKLQRLINKIKKLLHPDDHIVFVGDIIGNKRTNIKTFQLIEDLIKFHPNTFIIEGNHESNFINYLNSTHPQAEQNLFDPEIINEFFDYGVTSRKQEDIIHYLDNLNITFLHNLIPYYETEEILITHAPLDIYRFKYSSIYEGVLETDIFDLLYNFIAEEEEPLQIINFKKWSICGHQNLYSKRKEPSIFKETKKVFLDCGCGYQADKECYALDFNNLTIINSSI